jgi:FkbM family methyltransferase
MHDHNPALSTLTKLRPAKIRNAVRRRWFERQLSRTPLTRIDGLLDIGSTYGGWTLPAGLLERGWTCYSVGAGGDVSFDLELVRRYGLTVRSFDAVAEYVQSALEEADGEAEFTASQAAIATRDGPLRMQVTHHSTSRSVSAATLYDSHDFVELPGRALPSLMQELGDQRIELLKIDVEGSEYELLPTLDLRALGVNIFAIQLHHTGSVRDARRLIAWLGEQGYEPVACRYNIKLAFARRDIMGAAGERREQGTVTAGPDSGPS